jgi:thioesterase domain-containing protein
VYIGGEALARGYQRHPDWTAERFLPDPFSPIPSARLYKTGDLAAWSDDGQIQFLGRSDHQVKLRGFRIELSEVECVLGEDPQVASTVAVVREDRSGDRQLVAYLVPRNGHTMDVAALRERISRKAPGYMVPSAYVVLKDLPRTPSGKVDRRALPPPTSDRSQCDGSYVAPRTDVETALTQIWSEVLGVERVGVHDNFFQLGGHSLLAVRLFAQIEKRLRKKLDLSALFQGATVAELARIVDMQDASGGTRSIVSIQPHGSKTPLFLLHGLAGTALTWRALVQHFGPDQPIYGFEPPRENGTPQPLESIGDMAARYVADLLQFAAQGPYCLAGYSFGGWVAFEMACQLADMGKPVSLLAMVDTGPGRTRPGRVTRIWRDAPSIAHNIPFWVWDNIWRSPTKKLRARLRRETRTLWKRLLWRHQGGKALLRQELEDVVDTDANQLPDTLRIVMQAHMEAINEYRPRRFSGRVTLFRARTRPLFHSLDEDLGWKDLAAGGVEVIQIPGNHDSILEEPHVARLARRLQDCLDR